jgi:hypothetical protein
MDKPNMAGQIYISHSAMTEQGSGYNASGANLPSMTPTIEDLNHIMSYGQSGTTLPAEYSEPS